MAWNGSGTFSRTNGTNTGAEVWQDDAGSGTKIRADNHDTHDQDLADGIGACLTKNNETKPTANFAPNVNNSYDIGTASLKWKDGYFTGDVSAASFTGKTIFTQTAIATTSGTTATISSIPAGVRRINIYLDSVSMNGSFELGMQLGDSGGIELSGYNSLITKLTTSANTLTTDTGHVSLAHGLAAADVVSGQITLILGETSGIEWSITGTTYVFTAPTMFHTYAKKATSAELTQIQFSDVSGSASFDAGQIAYSYEY